MLLSEIMYHAAWAHINSSGLSEIVLALGAWILTVCHLLPSLLISFLGFAFLLELN
jgi:hypothetical protein